MQIARVSAHALKVPLSIDVPGVGTRNESFGCCVVEVETTDGLVGHGLTGITQEPVIAAIVNEVIAPNLVGKDPLAHEARWDEMYWLLCSRGQTGYAQHAMAAVDIALWDIKGHVLNTPIWRLIGGARRSVETYSTFGFDFLERDGNPPGQ